MSAVFPAPTDDRPPASARYLLLQMRKASDPMRQHEVGCFARGLNTGTTQIDAFDLLQSVVTERLLNRYDMVLLGGAGEFSAAAPVEQLDTPLRSLQLVHDVGKPTFASCWGFQAFARALGGRVLNDVGNAEVGTLDVSLTPEGRRDDVFGRLPAVFTAPMGHEDHVVELPPGAVHLARSERVTFQAFRFPDRPIYCTQFHPELEPADLVTRVRAYPEYLERIAGVTLDEFEARLRSTAHCSRLLAQFAACVLA